MFGCQRSQKNNIVNRFHRITPQKTSMKLKKIGFGAFKHVQVPMFGGFSKLCASRLRHSRGAISHVWTSKKPKKNNIVNRFHRIIPQKTSTKLKKKGFGAFKHVQVPMFGVF